MDESSLYYRMKREEAARKRRREKLKNSKILRFLYNNIAVLVLCIPLFIVMVSLAHQHYLNRIYQKAEELIASAEYEQAVEYLEKIREEDIKDTKDLITLCTSHIYYEQGKFGVAYDCYSSLRVGIHWENQTAVQKKAIAAYEAELEKAFQPIAEEREKLRQEKYEKYLQEIASAPPFVGMSEVYISKTVLGSPSTKLRGNTEIINGKRYHATIYDFLENGKVIFTARCIQGEVTEVWDERTNSTSSNVGTYKFSKESDPYNASSYRTAEAFYDANYEKFFCFEDAESYYHEHRND